MVEKQLRRTNTLLCLILIVLLISLAIDLIPYILAGNILNSFFRANNNTPLITFSTPESSNDFFISISPTSTPWMIFEAP
jgi:hypothetical protein